MGRWVLTLVGTAAAFFVAVQLVPGMALVSGPTQARTWGNLLLIALIFGVANAIIRPFIKGATCLIYVLTLGLFAFVVNALMLLLTAYISQQFNLGLVIDGFVAALEGSIVISILNIIFGVIIRSGAKD